MQIRRWAWIVACTTPLVLAQETPRTFERRIHLNGAVPGAGLPGDNMIVLSSEMSWEAQSVKGAPYSAESVTETIQILSDGNRIVRKNSSRIYRDSEGRTRREMRVSDIGLGQTGTPHESVTINDPVAKTIYILNPADKTARKLPALLPEMGRLPAEVKERLQAGAAGKNVITHTETKDVLIVRSDRPGSATPTVEPFSPPVPLPPGMGGVVSFERVRLDPKNTKEVDLGEQVREGIKVKGTRTTTTIPAGEIGNERPIETVSERWFSPELQTVVYSKRIDPRSGEVVYRLQGISRAEPARSLFELPPDYTVRELPDPLRRIEMLRRTAPKE